MSIFDTQLTYATPRPNFKERLEIGKVMLTPTQYTSFLITLALFCIAIPVTIFILTGFNFIFGGLFFVLADFLWELSLYYWAIIKPHIAMRQETLGAAKKKIQDVEARIDELDKKSKFCMNTDGPTEITMSDIARWEDEKNCLQTYLKFENVWVAESLTKYKQEELEMMQKPAKDYEDKRIFFEEFKERLEFHIQTNHLYCLKVVLDSVDELINTLNKRPNGYELVPTMFYVYIDELQKILVKIVRRDKDQIDFHMQDLTNVANALSQNINRMVSRINDSETAEIDIGLSVLLKELGGEEAAPSV